MSRLAAVLCVASGALPALALKLKMELEVNGELKPPRPHLDQLESRFEGEFEEKFDGELEEKYQGQLEEKYQGGLEEKYKGQPEEKYQAELEEKFEGDFETPRGDRSEIREEVLSDCAADLRATSNRARMGARLLFRGPQTEWNGDRWQVVNEKNQFVERTVAKAIN